MDEECFECLIKTGCSNHPKDQNDGNNDINIDEDYVAEVNQNNNNLRPRRPTISSTRYFSVKSWIVIEWEYV